MILTKKYWVLIGVVILAVLLGGILVYFGWTKQKSEPPKSRTEQSKPESVKEVKIPSSLNPNEVIIQFAPPTPLLKNFTEQEFRWEDFGIDHPNDGFIVGANAVWQEDVHYFKKDGTKVEGSSGPYSVTLSLTVLKYSKPKFAQEDYNRITTKQELRDLTLKGVKLRTKKGIPQSTSEETLLHTQIKPERWQQYLLYSNNFIIHAFGVREAAKDVISRAIDQYEVK